MKSLLLFVASSLIATSGNRVVVIAWSSSTSTSFLTRNNKRSSALGMRMMGSGGAAQSKSSSSNTEESSTCQNKLQRAEIIGAGRIGSLLAQAGNCVLLKRGDSIDASPEAEGHPILIATRNDALDGIIDNCPQNRRNDLVFLQNGYLHVYLARKGLSDNTQALLYLSVTAKDAGAIDGVTSFNPEGLTAATGVHAQAVADRLAALNLNCNVLTPKQYQPAMFEKLIWISTYMLVGTAKGCTSVGQAGSEYKDLIERVILELVAAVTQTENGILFENGTVERLRAYTDVVADFPCAVKEFEWRNQYFYNLGNDLCPTHNALLRDCASQGKLTFALP